MKAKFYHRDEKFQTAGVEYILFLLLHLASFRKIPFIKDRLETLKQRVSEQNRWYGQHVTK